MRFLGKNKKTGLILLGALLIAFGAAGLLPAQRNPGIRVLTPVADGPYLGVTLEDVTADNMARFKLNTESGVIVRSVEAGSPAEVARLQENDVILEYSGIKVISVAQLMRLVQETPVGRVVNLAVSRDGKRLDLTIKVGSGPAASRPGRIEVMPRPVPPYGRNFEFDLPDQGLFRFRVPGDRSRIFDFFLPDTERTGLGITAESLNDQMAEFFGVPGRKGVLVTSVAPGSAADKVLRAGDVILSVDGIAVAGPEALVRELSSRKAGAKIELKVVRERKEILLTVQLPGSDPLGRGVRI